jgi:hypothetical protein
MFYRGDYVRFKGSDDMCKVEHTFQNGLDGQDYQYSVELIDSATNTHYCMDGVPERLLESTGRSVPRKLQVYDNGGGSFLFIIDVNQHDQTVKFFDTWHCRGYVTESFEDFWIRCATLVDE